MQLRANHSTEFQQLEHTQVTRHPCCQSWARRCYLHDDWDPRWQGLCLEHIKLASLALAVEDASNEDCKQQHGDDDQARHDEGKQVLLVR